MGKNFWIAIVIMDVLFILGGLLFGGTPLFFGAVGLVFIFGDLVIVSLGTIMVGEELKFDSVLQHFFVNIIIMAGIVLLVWDVLFFVGLFLGEFVVYELIQLLIYNTIAVWFSRFVVAVNKKTQP